MKDVPRPRHGISILTFAVQNPSTSGTRQGGTCFKVAATAASTFSVFPQAGYSPSISIAPLSMARSAGASPVTLNA